MKQKFVAALKENLRMFAVFFKIGLFSFGGGYAMLSMIEHEVVDKHKWLTHDELLDVFAIAESTPGAISINIATFIGTKRAGVFGGIFTTLGVVLPSFLVILGLSYVIDLVRDNVWVGYLFRGIRIGALVLIVRGAVSFVKNTKRKVIAYVLMAAMFCLALFTEISVVYLMLGAIGISIVEVIVAHSVRYRKFLAKCVKIAGEYVRPNGGSGGCTAGNGGSAAGSVGSIDNTDNGRHISNDTVTDGGSAAGNLNGIDNTDSGSPVGNGGNTDGNDNGGAGKEEDGE